MRQAKREEEDSHNWLQLQSHPSCGQRSDIALFGTGDLRLSLSEMKEPNYTLELLGKATHILQY